MRKMAFLAAGFAAALGSTPALAARGTDGELKILFWQAVSTLNPYLSGGVKEEFASSIVLEPLASFNEKGELTPRLVETLPTAENGGISSDYTSVTWKLKPGVKWSDGSAFTADDVAFTWSYCTAPGGGCAQASKFVGIKSVEALDPLTVKVTFTAPKPYPLPGLRRRDGRRSSRNRSSRIASAPKAPGCTAANFGPIGTGPFKVQAFKPNDSISLCRQ